MFSVPPDISPGPWKLKSRTTPGWRIEGPDNKLVAFAHDNPYNAPNGEFIVWCRNNIDNLIYQNEKFKLQHEKLAEQTGIMREAYNKLLEIRNWLKATNQPDVLISEFEKIINDSQIFRESEM